MEASDWVEIDEALRSGDRDMLLSVLSFYYGRPAFELGRQADRFIGQFERSRPVAKEPTKRKAMDRIAAAGILGVPGLADHSWLAEPRGERKGVSDGAD